MIRYCALSVLLLLFTATYAQKKINKGEKWYRIYPGKALELRTDEEQNFSAQISEGKDLLFEYFMRADDYADMTDDEYTEKIIFQVPKTARSFNYSGKALQAAFLRGCFCPDRGWHPVSEGSIKGKKISANTWQVDIDVTTKADPSRNANPVNKKIKATFKVYNPPVPKKK